MDDIFDETQDPDKYDASASMQREKENQYNMGFYAGIETTYELMDASQSYKDGYDKGLSVNKENFYMAGVIEYGCYVVQ
jgi:histidinol phosphatase-like PHP family hydrolase